MGLCSLDHWTGLESTGPVSVLVLVCFEADALLYIAVHLRT